MTYEFIYDKKKNVFISSGGSKLFILLGDKIHPMLSIPPNITRFTTQKKKKKKNLQSFTAIKYIKKKTEI